jgi:hypothetical protein
MSISLMTAVWVLPVPPARKLVLLALADWADDDGGQCFPAIATIALRASISDRQAQRHMRSLMRDGWIAVARNEVGGRRSRQYQLAARRIYGALAAARASKNAVNDTCVTPPVTDTCVAPGVTCEASGGDAGVTRSNNIHHKRSSTSRPRAAAAPQAQRRVVHGVTCWVSDSSTDPADVAALVDAHGAHAVEAEARALSARGIDPLPSAVSAKLLAAAAAREAARRAATPPAAAAEDAATAAALAEAQMAAYRRAGGGA